MFNGRHFTTVTAVGRLTDRGGRGNHRCMIIRDETIEDRPAVRQVTAAAFEGPAEADLVAALSDSGDVAFSLVAEEAGTIIGHILFSRLRAPDRCLALAPVSVAPDRQRQGIGSRLVREGLARAGRDGWLAVFLVGDPAFYGRFGFRAAAAAKFETPYPKRYFLAIELAPGALDERSGAVIYPPAFETLS